MQVCGFVDGLVGGRIYLPACLYPLFFPLLFFVFVFGYRPLDTGIQKTTSAAGERWQMTIEMCRWSFCAENERLRGED